MLLKTDSPDRGSHLSEPLGSRKVRMGWGRHPAIRCRFCQNIITSTDAVTIVAGQHRHSFKNPAGIHYEIGCFSSAKGCLHVGEPTAEYTWFPGFSWNYAVCGKCSIHLGWFYQAGGSHFYGLIVDRLIGEK